MKKSYKLTGDICANCAGKIQNRINKIDGVSQASVNALTLKFTLDADDARFDSIVRESVKVFNAIEPDCEVLV